MEALFGHPGPTQNRESNHISKKATIHSVFPFVPHIILFVRFFRIAGIQFIQKWTREVQAGGMSLYCQSSVPDLRCTILPSLPKVQKKSFDFVNRHKLSRKSQLTFSGCLPCPKHRAAKYIHVHSHSHSRKDGVVIPSS